MKRTTSPVRPALSPFEQVLLGLLFLGAIAMLSLPAARATSAGMGWMPLWLLAMPAASLATATLLRLSRRRVAESSSFATRRRAIAAPAPRRRSARVHRTSRLLAAIVLR